MQGTLVARKESIGRILADFMRPKDWKGRRPQEDLGTRKAGTEFLSLVFVHMHSPSLWLCKGSQDRENL